MSPTEKLRAAKLLLTDPAKWTQGAFARDASGYQVKSGSPVAVAWCAVGALIRSGSPFDRSIRFLNDAGPKAFEGVPDYNDALFHHADLLAWFDRAITLAEQAE